MYIYMCIYTQVGYPQFSMAYKNAPFADHVPNPSRAPPSIMSFKANSWTPCGSGWATLDLENKRRWLVRFLGRMDEWIHGWYYHAKSKIINI